MADFKDLTNPWNRVRYYQSKGRLEKKDILAALESSYPVPEDAKPILKTVIIGNYRKRGPKPGFWEDSQLMQLMISEWVDSIETALETSDFSQLDEEFVDSIEKLLKISLNDDFYFKSLIDLSEEVNRRLQGGLTARQAAKNCVALLLKRSVRSVETIIGLAQN